MVNTIAPTLKQPVIDISNYTIEKSLNNIRNILSAINKKSLRVSILFKEKFPRIPDTKIFSIYISNDYKTIEWFYNDPWVGYKKQIPEPPDITSALPLNSELEIKILKNYIKEKYLPWINEKNNKREIIVPLHQAIVLLFNNYNSLLSKLLKIYKIKYKNNIPSYIWYSELTHQIEINYDTMSYLNADLGNLIPERLLQNRLIDLCKCCNKYYWCGLLNKFDPIKRKEILDFIFDRYDNKKKISKKELSKLNIKTTNKITERIQNILNTVLYYTNSDNIQQKEPVLITDYPLIYLNDSDLPLEKQCVSICDTCLRNKFPIFFSSTSRNNKFLEQEDKYIFNYTDNPLNYYQGFHLYKGETPTFLEYEKNTLLSMRFDEKTRKDIPIYKIIKERFDTTLYMGIELEVTPKKELAVEISKQIGNNNLQSTEAQVFTSRLITEFTKNEQVAIIKRDGSVPSGFEIVSVPGTHAWHTKVAWNKFFKENYQEEEARLAPSSFIAGWINNGPTSDHPERHLCGMHIHVSRNALSPLQLGKLITFTGEPSNLRFIEDIAGRCSTSFHKFYKKKITDGRVLRKNRTMNNITDIGKYHAINLNTGTKPTIEFRIFRSNVAKAGFMKNIDFVHALVTWCKEASANDLTVQKFIDYVEEHRSTYEYLYKWLLKKQYTKATYKPNPEYINKKIINIETGKPILIKVPNKGYQPEQEEAA